MARAPPAGAGAPPGGGGQPPTPPLPIRLAHAAPDLPARIAMSRFCAVPPDTPIRSGGVEHIPSAGPYYISSHTRGTELVLRRNPNYHGPRPRRFDTIDYRFGVNPAQAA